ncbi:MAG TPA: lytic transglycosylase domain-containing protein, partial [Polyangiaceae bacterium]|nr:lytic transglycosylase domain-containing protein [Polyangiaceae bacterium]
AFGQKNKTPAPPAAGPSLPPIPGNPSDPPPLLGLSRRSSSASEPQALGGGYGGLPPLREPSGSELGAPSLPELLRNPERGSSEHRRVAQRTPSAVSSTAARGRKYGSSPRRRAESGEQRWWVGALAALGVCVVVLGIVLVAVTITRRNNEGGGAVNTASGGATATNGPATTVPSGAAAALPRARLTTDDERFRSLLTQVHGRGGKESAELRALLDEQAATAAQALQPGCVGPQCKALAEVGKLVTSSGKRRVKRRAAAPASLRSGWLAGLDMPEIPVEDDPRVQKRFEFYTANPLGRETFQQMMFRCGAHNDMIQSSLIRHGLPKDLIAVAYAESGCYALAKSPAGAEGLWQFIPDAARAFHLRIIDGVVDERHSPQKSTEAAIQYFGDMYAKFGSWDLVFSAYNMGPFGLATRLEHVECSDGEPVGFWELVDAEMLPGETADYAPAIQAIALILNNLAKLKFGGVQKIPPQMTMDLQVPPNTRLSLVARAAGLSATELRKYNLDIDGTSTPNVPGFAVQVPKDSVWQARDTLQELLKSKDESDLCVPQNFDWGRQRFTAAMQEACARNLAARTETPPAPGAP